MSDPSYASVVAGSPGSNAIAVRPGTEVSAQSAMPEMEQCALQDVSYPPGPSGSSRSIVSPKPYCAGSVLRGASGALRKLNRTGMMPKYQWKWMEWRRQTGNSDEVQFGRTHGWTFPQRKARSRKRPSRCRNSPPAKPPAAPPIPAPRKSPVKPEPKEGDLMPETPEMNSVDPMDHVEPEVSEIESLKRRVADLEMMLLQVMGILPGHIESVLSAQAGCAPMSEQIGHKPLQCSTASVQTESIHAQTNVDVTVQTEVEDATAGTVTEEVKVPGSEDVNDELKELPEVPCQKQAPGPSKAPSDVTTDACVGTSDGGHNFQELLDEFTDWIHMKTRGLKRDQAFVKMLPGLMQRWIKLKKLETTPQPFVNGLVRACYEKVKLSREETELANIISDPETRFDVQRFNEAVTGEVKGVEEAFLRAWVRARVMRVPLWIPNSLRMIVEKLMSFPWTRAFGGYCILNLLAVALLRGWKPKCVLLFVNMLLGMPAFIKFCRWLKFRNQFLRGEFTREGYFRGSGMVNVFHPGNGSSR